MENKEITTENVGLEEEYNFNLARTKLKAIYDDICSLESRIDEERYNTSFIKSSLLVDTFKNIEKFLDLANESINELDLDISVVQENFKTARRWLKINPLVTYDRICCGKNKLYCAKSNLSKAKNNLLFAEVSLGEVSKILNTIKSDPCGMEDANRQIEARLCEQKKYMSQRPEVFEEEIKNCEQLVPLLLELLAEELNESYKLLQTE